MAANKGAPRRKRAAPESGGAKKKPTEAAKKRQAVAAKRKHVRELAKAGRWNEIERLYGKKIVIKAKTYVETQGAKKKTPLEIANEILIKNGYLPCVPDTAASRTPPALIVHQTAGSGTRECRPERIIAAAAPDSPVKLTKEQQKRIETRRQEALERRRRVQQVARTSVHPPPAVIQPSRPPPDEAHRRSRQAVVPVQEQHLLSSQISRRESSSSDGQQETDTHRVVTVGSRPRTNVVAEIKHARPECFWDDLEAAAEIVQWENEHMAEAALEPQAPAAKIAPDEECGGSQQSSHYRRELPTAIPNQPPAVISFSQELLAAADIIQWEKEHESLPEVPAALGSPGGDSSDGDRELDAPQFQLLPVHVTDDLEQPSSDPRGSVHDYQVDNNSFDRPISNGQQHPSRQPHHRSWVAAPQPALPHTNAVPARVTETSGVQQLHQTASHPPQSHHSPTTTEFIDKHLLEDKLEFPVLEFLDMMLA
uniref:Uncharacterized protein n=1 Tax=Peronospora matthiolae TaxID=2874970 RepID=A0AAV1UF33_9STRA